MDAVNVQELLVLNLTRWDLDLVQEVFCDRDVHLIQSIPLSSRKRPDWWKWRGERKGIYSVKSAYKMLQDWVSVTDEGGNDIVWGQRLSSAPAVLWVVHTVCQEWAEATSTPQGPVPRGTMAGHPPSCLIRDHQGNILHIFAQVFDAPPDPTLAEAIGMKAVLSWLKLTPILCHVIESDCLLLVNALKNVVSDLS
ncbi:hypothetical protein K2173_011966 [Erythroxylum novogranatense]|uniref:RNase H type-1 domain-containing protein n=1 Tax=Erythroxylum novogranatense TaxID=1862640 RepID=A0AAV8TGW3_9ROSI|nr:hypothetical protein K2173_011966 [Erythroxylum novogranatense]